ncbi:MAG TPA: hypothetical protein ENN56_03745 [Firmicutes bacterium]|nr:hypothetical protein [Bacillota bacterium]
MSPHVRDTVLAGLVIAMGIGFPIALHLTGGTGIGRMFLPMFLPLAAGAFLLRPVHAMFTGAITPMLSALLTGMPPLAPPVAFLMVGELFVLTGVISILTVRTHLNEWIILTYGVIAERFILAVLAAGLSSAFGLPPQLVTWGSLIVSMPGIVLLFIVVPPVVGRVRKNRRYARGFVGVSAP